MFLHPPEHIQHAHQCRFTVRYREGAADRLGGPTRRMSTPLLPPPSKTSSGQSDAPWSLCWLRQTTRGEGELPLRRLPPQPSPPPAPRTHLWGGSKFSMEGFSRPATRGLIGRGRRVSMSTDPSARYFYLPSTIVQIFPPVRHRCGRSPHRP